MKNKKAILVILLALVLLIGGASVLYDKLGQKVASNQLLGQKPDTGVQTQTPVSGESAKTEATQTPMESELSAESAKPEENAAGTERDPSASIPAPDFTAYDAQGNEVRLSDYFGKPIVLNFWASWCGPCQSEMPDFHDKYLELNGEVLFLMVNATGGRETVESAMAFIQEKGYTFPVLYDLNSDAIMTYRAYSLPTTFFIDAEGYAVAQAVGAITAETLQRGIDMIMP